jgi:prepilin-type N-terminal cleavage/methylation domain-containing protein
MVATVRNNSGFSLIEVMIALVILLISLLGLLSVLINSIGANLDDESRNTAIRLINQTAETIHSLPIRDTDIRGDPRGVSHARQADDLSQDLKGFPKPAKSIRGFQQNYSILWNVTDKDENLKEIIISVTYSNSQRENCCHNAVIYKHSTL